MFARRFPERARHRIARRAARRPRARGRRHRDAGADPLRAREAGARGRQARLRREAARDAGRGDGGARRARRGERARPDARPSAALPPGRPQAEGAHRLGRARRRALHLRQPSEPRQDPQGRERAVVARRPRPLGDPLPRRRGARRGERARKRLPQPRRRGRRLLLPALPERQDRPPAPLLARPAQDAEAHGRRPRQDGGVRRHGARAQGDDLREGPEQPAQSYGEWQTRTGDILSPKIANDEPLRLELSHFLRLVREGSSGVEARDGLAVVRVLERLQESLVLARL